MVQTEYEVRMLDIELDDMIQKVESLGATQIGVYLQKRYVYDFVPAQKGHWIRLRFNGKETTLTIKEIKSSEIDGTKELEIVVSDFNDTNEILKRLGYLPRSFQENFRIEYSLNGVNLDIDKWPMIPAYLEIEGTSERSVFEILKRLEINNYSVTTMNVDKIYKKNGIQLDTIKNLSFSSKEMQLIEKYLKYGGSIYANSFSIE